MAEKAEVPTAPTSLLKIYNRGFTLLEMMVVLAIVAGLAVAAISRLGSGRNNEIKSMLRHMTALSKDLHTRAKLKGYTYRIVIDLKEGEKSKDQTYWVEKSNSGMLMSKDEEQKVREYENDPFGDQEKKQPPKGYAPDEESMKEPRSLPSGVFFQQVELSRLDAPITSGKAFIHYLPQGLVDEAAIHLVGEKDTRWTISIHPLTGKAELISKSLSLKEIKNQ